jgi:hypothetical protein
MELFTVTLLGVIAVASLVQAVLLLGLARAGIDLARRVAAWEERFEWDVRPAIEDLRHVAKNAGRITDGIVRQMPAVEALVQETSHRVRSAGEAVDRLVVRPLAPVTATAFLIAAARRVRGRRSSSRVS